MAKNLQLNLGGILTGIVILLIPLVSAVAGCYGTWVFSTRPYAPEATQWQLSGPLPAKAIKILGKLRDRGDLVVQTDDGGRYRYICRERNPGLGCWQKVEVDEEIIPLKDIQEKPAFDAPNPPGRVVDSVSIPLPAIPEVLRQANFAVLEDGSVWVWDYTNLGLGALAFLMLAVFGAAVSYGIGSIISFVIAVKLWGRQQAIIWLATGLMILVILGALFFLIPWSL